jgi:hypothetical protein
MKATEFISKWKDLIKDLKRNPKFITKYQTSTEWTKFILGGSSCMSTGSPLGDAIASKNNKEGLCYRTEDAKIDIAFGKENFEVLDIKNTNEIKIDDCFYPKVYEIIVEHENNIDDCWREMAKLTSFRAKLKVLITYNWGEDENDKKDYSKNIETTAQNFGKIIKQTNEAFPENPDTEYLLIIGQRKEESVFWHYYIYNAGIIMEVYKD